MFNVEYIKNSNKSGFLNVIIPIRMTKNYNMIDRIILKHKICIIPDIVNFIIVDDGTDDKYKKEIIDVSLKLKIDYLRIDSQHVDFSLSRARNMGVMYSESKFCMFEDIDFIGYNTFYNDIINEIKIQNMEYDNRHFINIPIIFLTKYGTRYYLSQDNSVNKNIIIQKLIENDENIIDFYQPALSCLVVHRNYFLTQGGFNERFSGWGCEDLEFFARALSVSRYFIKPKLFNKLINTPILHLQHKYEGFRTMLRLYGEVMSRKGIYAVHAYHDVDTAWRNKKLHQNNVSLLKSTLNNIRENRKKIKPLTDPSTGRCIMFNSGCFAYNRALLPFFGDTDVIAIDKFSTTEEFFEHFKKNNYAKIIFTNPFKDKKIKDIYYKAKKDGIKFYVVERGALPDSMYIDSTGFCCDSKMYNPIYWDHNLSAQDRSNTLNYINNYITNPRYLENQSQQIGKDNLRYKLGLSKNTKIIFVPLQSRSDVTVNMFCGNIKSFDNFITLVNEVAKKLPHNYRMLVKKHPLSLANENISNIISVDNYNIDDLIDISDYILLMNSGAGVLGILKNKKVICTSQAFYNHHGICISASSSNDILKIIDNGFNPDSEKQLRFISYLINNFYSFGKMKTKISKYTKNSNMSITKTLIYYKVSIDLDIKFSFDDFRMPIESKSFIYDIYRNTITQAKKEKSFKIKNKFIFIICSYILSLTNKRLYKKFNTNTYKFFLDSKSLITKKIGEIIFMKKL